MAQFSILEYIINGFKKTVKEVKDVSLLVETRTLTHNKVEDELKRLGDVIFNQATFRLERIHTAPDKPRGGDKRYASGNADADGSWDPGSGEGIYFFKETTSAWVKLG